MRTFQVVLTALTLKHIHRKHLKKKFIVPLYSTENSTLYNQGSCQGTEIINYE